MFIVIALKSFDEPHLGKTALVTLDKYRLNKTITMTLLNIGMSEARIWLRLIGHLPAGLGDAY